MRTTLQYNITFRRIEYQVTGKCSSKVSFDWDLEDIRGFFKVTMCRLKWNGQKWSILIRYIH